MSATQNQNPTGWDGRDDELHVDFRVVEYPEYSLPLRLPNTVSRHGHKIRLTCFFRKVPPGTTRLYVSAALVAMGSEQFGENVMGCPILLRAKDEKQSDPISEDDDETVVELILTPPPIHPREHLGEGPPLYSAFVNVTPAGAADDPPAPVDERALMFAAGADKTRTFHFPIHVK